ncbi:MAG: ribosome biogenesis GTPase YlqF, partial [Oscillospiraceae bacterium]|nr:ribosome biogenesis GTPase YlqF [Oscillospiraceae bacterium]
MNIQWYPGHMAKTRRQLEGDINGADGVIVLLDARIPASSSNPDIVTLQKEKPCLTVLGRADTADPDITALWKKA